MGVFYFRLFRIQLIKNNILFLLPLLFICFFFLSPASAQKQPEVNIMRTEDSPRIDGSIMEDIWHNATTITEFTQYEPVLGANPAMPTRVRLLYDNEALYIAAEMLDSSPDSIARQLGASTLTTISRMPIISWFQLPEFRSTSGRPMRLMMLFGKVLLKSRPTDGLPK